MQNVFTTDVELIVFIISFCLCFLTSYQTAKEHNALDSVLLSILEKQQDFLSGLPLIPVFSAAGG